MKFTLDLTDEQVSYIRQLVIFDVGDRNREVRSPVFATYGPDMQQRTHEELRIGSSVMGLLPVRRVNADELMDEVRRHRQSLLNRASNV